ERDGVGGIPALRRQVGDGDGRTFAGEGDRHGPTDARVATGHEGALAVEPAVATVGVFAVVGCRGHLGRATGRFLLLWGESDRRHVVLLHPDQHEREAPATRVAADADRCFDGDADAITV